MNERYSFAILFSVLLIFISGLDASFASEHKETDHETNEESEKDKIKQKAKEHGEKARDASHSKDEELAAFHHVKAAEYHEQLEHYDKAAMHYEKAAKKFESLEDIESAATYHNKAANLYKLLDEEKKSSIEKAKSLHQRRTIKFGDSYVLPPKHQMEIVSLPEYITCNEGLELVLKSHHDEPACVKPSSIEKLMERGWAIKHISHKTKTEG